MKRAQRTLAGLAFAPAAARDAPPLVKVYGTAQQFQGETLAPWTWTLTTKQ